MLEVISRCLSDAWSMQMNWDSPFVGLSIEPSWEPAGAVWCELSFMPPKVNNGCMYMLGRNLFPSISHASSNTRSPSCETAKDTGLHTYSPSAECSRSPAVSPILSSGGCGSDHHCNINRGEVLGCISGSFWDSLALSRSIH